MPCSHRKLCANLGPSSSGTARCSLRLLTDKARKSIGAVGARPEGIQMTTLTMRSCLTRGRVRARHMYGTAAASWRLLRWNLIV